jgi:hypothetical protein
MNKNEVRVSTEELIKKENNGKWKYELGQPSRSQFRSNEWNVTVNWFNSDGTPDDPGIIIVDDSTGDARFFMTL